MPPIVSTVEIAAPPGDVFAYAADPLRFAEWQDDVVTARMDDGDATSVGSRFTTTRRIAGAQRTMTQQVSEARPPTTWAARGVDGPIRPNATITIEPLDGGARSRVTFALDFEGRGIGVALLPLVRRMTQRTAPRSYRKLKERLEAQRSA
jgi:uncharacterized protein YndB with AHSA1/START domain